MTSVARSAGQPGLVDLLAAYHLATEAEKGVPVAATADLPDRYRAEIDDPVTAFAADIVNPIRITQCDTQGAYAFTQRYEPVVGDWPPRSFARRVSSRVCSRRMSIVRVT